MAWSLQGLELDVEGHLRRAARARNVVAGVERVVVEPVSDIADIGFEGELIADPVLGHQVAGQVTVHRLAGVSNGGLLAAKVDAQLHAPLRCDLVRGMFSLN